MKHKETAAQLATLGQVERGVGRLCPKRKSAGMQKRLHDKLRDMPNRMGSVTELAVLLRTSRLAVYSSARALHRRGLAVQWIHAGDGEGCQMVAYREPRNVGAKPGGAVLRDDSA